MKPLRLIFNEIYYSIARFTHMGIKDKLTVFFPPSTSDFPDAFEALKDIFENDKRWS